MAPRTGAKEKAVEKDGDASAPRERDLTVVVPAYNESATIEQCLRRVLAQPFVAEVIVVDDGSTDETLKLVLAIDDPRIRAQSLPRNMGKGAAVRFGLASATSDFVAIQDADLEYDPAELGKLLGPLRDGRADVVYGSRFRSGEEHRVLFYWHSLGNKFLTTMSNVFTNLNLTDMETGYKVFRREVLETLVIEEDRFGVEPEITAKVAAQRLRVYEIGISYSGRTYSEGKKIGWRDGVRALYAVGKYAAVARTEVRWQEKATTFDDADAELLVTLDSLKDSVNYNNWIADLVAPHLSGRVLEIGAGQGAITAAMAERGLDVTALEPSPGQCAALREATAHLPNVTVVEGMLETLPETEKFDSVVMVNVLEHVERDVAFLRLIAQHCTPGANVVAWVPAHKVLFSDFDRKVGHFRRYSRSRLRAAAESAHMSVEVLEFVNVLGAAAWLSGVKLMRLSPSDSGATGIYDRQVVPRLRRFEERRSMPLGQSLLLVAKVAEPAL